LSAFDASVVHWWGHTDLDGGKEPSERLASAQAASIYYRTAQQRGISTLGVDMSAVAFITSGERADQFLLAEN
jgi:hypothetical protein